MPRFRKGKRRSKRIKSVLPVRLWIAGSKDSHLAHTLDVSNHGVQLGKRPVLAVCTSQQVSETIALKTRVVLRGDGGRFFDPESRREAAATWLSRRNEGWR